MVARSLPLTEASLAWFDQALWLATANIARFRKQLDAAGDEDKRRQLEGLLKRELVTLAGLSASAHERADSSIDGSIGQQEAPAEPAT